MKGKICVFIMIFIARIAFSQNVSPENYLTNHENERTTRQECFTKINDIFKTNLNTDFNYPLNDGDFWEYIEENIEKFSVVKEVIGDTIFSNGKKYNKIKIYQCANSSEKEPVYEYQRNDANGNVYLYYNAEDKLLYDFSKSIGETFSSPFSNFYWYVANKYFVIGFGDTLQAIDFELYDYSHTLKHKETIIDNFGITYYIGDKDLYSDRPEGKFWGAVLSNIKYGDLLAIKQKINWNKYYPLDVGDFWKYEEITGSAIYSTITKKIIKDTLLSDGYNYKKIKTIRNSSGSSLYYYYERIDSVGNIYEYDAYNQGFRGPKYKFSSCIGDTFIHYLFNYQYFRIEDKYQDGIILQTHNTPASEIYYFDKDFGLTFYIFDQVSGQLIGSVINNEVFGDTGTTSVNYSFASTKNDFSLYQNYPNPFNPTTTITYSLPNSGIVTIKVFDILGRALTTLINEEKSAGTYLINFDGSNLSSGVYFYSIKTDNFFQTKNMVLIK